MVPADADGKYKNNEIVLGGIAPIGGTWGAENPPKTRFFHFGSPQTKLPARGPKATHIVVCPDQFYVDVLI